MAINLRQEQHLKTIVKKGGKIDIVAAQFDMRTINALERRGFVKTSENNKGIFVTPTAKGKKFIN